jgi:hypothetical protein
MNEQPSLNRRRLGVFLFLQVSNCPWREVKHVGLFTPPSAIILQPPWRLTAMVMGDDQGKGRRTKKVPSFYHNGPEMAIRIKYICCVFFCPKPHEKNEKMVP